MASYDPNNVFAKILRGEYPKRSDDPKTKLYDEFKRVADEGIQPVESHDVPEILRRRLLKLESDTDRYVSGLCRRRDPGIGHHDCVGTTNPRGSLGAYTPTSSAARRRLFRLVRGFRTWRYCSSFLDDR